MVSSSRSTFLRRLLAANGRDLFLDAALTFTSVCLEFGSPFFLKYLLSVT
jgi:hypothetical protein